MEEIDHEDIKVRLFSQSLVGEAREWFTNLPNSSIVNYQDFEYSFKEKWVETKDPRRYLSQFYSMRREESESILEFSKDS